MFCLFKVRWLKIVRLPMVFSEPRSHVEVFRTFVKDGL